MNTDTSPVGFVTAVVGLVGAILALLVAFGIDVTPAMRDAIIAVIVAAAPIVTYLWLRRKVTPVAAPKDPADGTPLVRQKDLQPTRAAVKLEAKEIEKENKFRP